MEEFFQGLKNYIPSMIIVYMYIIYAFFYIHLAPIGAVLKSHRTEQAVAKQTNE